MIVVGIDPHKHSHTACAVDGASGVMLGELTVKARRAGHEQLVEWARELGRELLFAVEDVRRCSGGLERFLLDRGEAVVRVAPKLMGASRRHERSFGKSDSIDARAVARAALREPDLPRAHLAGIERDIALLLDRREELIAERVRLVGLLRWHLHDLDPDFQIPQAALRNEVWAERAARRLARMQPSVQVRISRDMLRRIRALTKEAQALERELVARVREDAPSLVELPGCGVLTAAKIVAEVAGIERFATAAKLATHAGVAPLSASSGMTTRHRLSRKGNRSLNCALHRMALTQARVHPAGRDYVERKMAEGKSRREALRCLKRQLIRPVFAALQADARRASIPALCEQPLT